MGRPPCCDKSNVKKGPWTPEEDAKVLAYVASHGIGNWTLVPEKAGLNRCGKSCRLRWTNYLRPDLKHDAFTPQEEEQILKLHKCIGSRWSLIAKHLPGRTDNDVKNHWNTKLRKKLIKMEIDPVTRKPFSQILAEFGNLSPFPNARSYVNSLNNSVNNKSSMLISEPSIVTTEYKTPTTPNRPALEQFQGNPLTNNCLYVNTTPFQSTIHPYFFNEVSSSASSSSSSSSSRDITQLSSPQSFPFRASQQLQTIPSISTSNWCDYLLGDFSTPENTGKQPEGGLQGSPPSSYPEVKVQNDAAGYNCPEDASSAVDSFVDSILNRDTELQSDFPELFLDGYFNC